MANKTIKSISLVDRDDDIIEFINKKMQKRDIVNFSDYVKRLIREEIEKEKNPSGMFNSKQKEAIKEIVKSLVLTTSVAVANNTCEEDKTDIIEDSIDRMLEDNEAIDDSLNNIFNMK